MDRPSITDETAEAASSRPNKARNVLEELMISQLKQHHATVTAAIDKRVIDERLKREGE